MKRTFYIAGIFLAFFLFSFCAKAQDDQASPPAMLPGLQVNRTKLIGALKFYNAGLNFRHEKDVKDKQNFTAYSADGEQMQLLGSEDNLVLASWNYTIKRDKITNLNCLNHVTYFMQYMGGTTGTDWLKQQLKYIVDNPNGIYTQSIQLNNNRQAEFSYNSGSRVITLKFTPFSN